MSEWDDWLEAGPVVVLGPGTTAQMDGIYTPEHYADRSRVMQQCIGCCAWTEQNTRLSDPAPCTNCQATTYDPTSTISLRTFNPLTAKKRKPRGKRK